MKVLAQNRQKMWYSMPRNNFIYDANGNRIIDAENDFIVYANGETSEPTEDIYCRDEEGNIIYTEVDGEQIPVLSEVKEYYYPPTVFKANISFNSGETNMAEFGLNPSDYSAIISANKGELPFNERTLIWHKSKPEVDELGRAKPESADYRVIAIKTSLNEERFILKKRVDDE